MVTYGGKDHVELVFGRKPRDIVTIEHSALEQLSVPISNLDQMDQTLQKVTMQSYLEARQRADLRRDIAARLLPTEGPYSPGDRVYYWQVDKSKIKTWRHLWSLVQGESSLSRRSHLCHRYRCNCS